MDAGIDKLSMFLLGLLGSGHCLGMCGPLVVALPGQFGRWRAHFMYHAGRLATYTALGAVLGGISQGIASPLTPEAPLLLAGRVQIAVSLLAAALLLAMGLSRLGFWDEPSWLLFASPRKIPGFNRVAEKTISHRSMRWMFAMGLMLGLLPCGLSYGAFARAMAAGSLAEGAILALLFGLGTLPALLALGTSAGALLRRWRAQTELLAGLLMIGMALSLTAKAWTAIF